MSEDSKPTSWRPTRKMMTIAITGIATAAAMQWSAQLAELSPWLDFLTDDKTKSGLPVLVAWAIAYWIAEK